VEQDTSRIVEKIELQVSSRSNNPSSRGICESRVPSRAVEIPGVASNGDWQREAVSTVVGTGCWKIVSCAPATEESRQEGGQEAGGATKCSRRGI
jgi:hypothetical protein